MTDNMRDEAAVRIVGDFLNEYDCRERGDGFDFAPRLLAKLAAAAPLLVSAEAERAEAELSRLHSWAGLMELLDEHWPESFIPTAPDDPTRDSGPRIVSLLRWVEGLRAELAERDAKLREAMRVSEWRVSAKDDEVFAIAVATLTQHWDCGDGL